MAISYNINIITGSMPYIENEKLYNVGFLCRRDGSIERYTKVHATPDEEKVWGMTGENQIQTFNTDCGKIGILICYDVELFERIKLGKITCIYSELVETELVKAPKKIRDFFVDLPKESLEKVEITDDILALAIKYVEEKVVGETSFDDCIHIATTTIHRADDFGR